METATVNISMPQTMKDDVDKVIVMEGYGNTSEFFRDLVRRHLRESAMSKLDALIAEGLGSGDFTPLTHQDFEEIKKRGLERIKARQIKHAA